MPRVAKSGVVRPFDRDNGIMIAQKGMCPMDGNYGTSSRNRPYAATTPYLRDIRLLLIDNLFDQGLEIWDFNFRIADDVYETLRDDSEKILPDDIYDAIYGDNSPTRIGDILEYVNAFTGTAVHIDATTNTIIAVYPNRDMEELELSKYFPYICGTKPVPEGMTLIVKCCAGVIKGSGSACGTPSLPDPNDPENSEPKDGLGKLDWKSIVSKKGETRQDHIDRHGTPDPDRETHGVFNGDPKTMVDEAWANRGGIKPLDDGMGGQIYNIPYPNAGYESGFIHTGEVMNFITIVVMDGTSQLISAFPSFGNFSR